MLITGGKLKKVAFCFLLEYNIKNTNMSITYNPKNKKRKRTHGFLSRMKTVGGKKVVSRRRNKGRVKIAC